MNWIKAVVGNFITTNNTVTLVAYRVTHTIYRDRASAEKAYGKRNIIGIVRAQDKFVPLYLESEVREFEANYEEAINQPTEELA